MKRWAWVAVFVGAALCGRSWAAPAPAPSHASRLATVTFEIRHRVFHDFADRQQVKLNQEFSVGDTDFTARVVQYVPDFAMDMKTRKVISRSNEPKNPAFKIIVKQRKAVQDTTWAMINMPPHFARNSLLAFRVMRIDFVGRAPIVRPDSSAQAPAPAHPAKPEKASR